MQSQEQRDEKTLAISTAIGVFVLTLGLGAAVLGATSSVFDWSNDLAGKFFIAVSCTAGALAIVSLARARNR